MSYTRSVLREVGALCGHPDPEKFADFILAPPCAHHGPWFFGDDDVCPEPCGLQHWFCAACFRPMKPECPIVDPE